MYDQKTQRIYNSIERQILQDNEDSQKYKLDIPFLTHDIFLSLVKKTIIYGNEAQTIQDFSKLYTNNFIN